MPPARRGAASRTQQPSFGKAVIAAGIVGAGAAAYFQFPGVAVLWLAFIVAAWMEPPAIMTGKKDPAGFPTPAHPGEERNLRRSRFWRPLKVRMFLPNLWWMPGWPPLAAWFAGLVCAAAAWCLPVSEVVPYAAEVNAATAFLTCVTVTAARRSSMPEGPGCPGTRLDSVGKVLAPPKGLVVLAIALLVATAAAWAVLTFVPVSGPWSLRLPYAAAGSAAALAIALVIAYPWKTVALARWRMLADQGGIWDQRWIGIKMDPPPQITDHYQVGSATVDEFTAPANLGAQAFLPLAPKITPAVGAGYRVAMLEMPNTDRQGQPQPGTVHPLRFQVVAWPSAEMPDLTDPTTPQDVVELFARSAFVWTTDALGYGRAVLLGAEKISEDPTPPPPPARGRRPKDKDRVASDVDRMLADGDEGPDEPQCPGPDDAPEHQGDAIPANATAAWSSTWAFPGGPSLTEIRQLLGDMTANFGCEVLIDHRANGGSGYLYFGALTAESTVFTAGDAAANTMANLAREDKWVHIWSQVLKQGSNPPVIQHPTLRTVAFPGQSGDVTLTRVGFVTRMGMDPADYRGLEPKLATALDASPFVSVIGWAADGQPAGSRHPQAFGIVWADGPVPSSPAKLPDCEASRWILAGRINAAFDAARLARPEVAASRILTARNSRGHIWEATLHLYGGVTLSDVRGMYGKIKRELGVPWLRIAPAESGATLYAGAKPEDVTLARPRRDEMRLKQLDWNQAFAESKITGNSGLLPDLTAMGTLPKNKSVQVLDFSLPPGLDMAKVKDGLKRLCVATGNDFIEVRPGVSGASSMRLLVAEVNPLPARVAFDFEEADRATGIVFATGIDGEPLEFNPSESPHALLAGVTGAGKSVLAQAFLYGAAINGADIYVIDPIKGGADFQFVKGHARAFASTSFEAAAVLKAVYAQVVERKNANAAAGVGSYLELTDPPSPIYVMIDEFTSLMGQSPVPKQSDDPEIEAEREQLIADNLARQSVGVIAGKLAREARSAGVTLLLGTQKLTAKILDTIPGAGDLKVNLARVLLGKASYGDRASALRAFDDAPMLEGDIPKGRGLWEPLTSSAVVIQTWYAPQSELGENLRRRVPELPDDRKPDLAPFMPKEPDPSEAPGAVIEVDEEDRTIDAGDFEFSLDDLELDDDSGDGDPQDDSLGESAAGTEPEVPDPPTMPAVPSADVRHTVDDGFADTVMFLDVDGVLAPIGQTNPAWNGWRPIDGSGAGSAMASSEMTGRLLDLHAPMAWLTTWTDEAPPAFAGLLPTGMLVLDRVDGDSGWWKLDALVDHLASHPEVRRIVWADDDLADLDDALGVAWKEIASEVLDACGVEYLLISPDPATALTPEDLENIRQWLSPADQRDDTEVAPAPAPALDPEPAEPANESDPFADGPEPIHATPVDGARADRDDDPFARTPVPRARQRRVTAGQSNDDPFA